MDIREIGNTIKQRRKSLKVTQKDLAEIVGISLRSIVDIENGKGNPTFAQIEKILNALGLIIETRLRT
ncbi:MAG: type II toxin-antitoxin system Y4mF family antitoxin [Ignavibacteriaceae bacterium]|jgi:y4mF family transcriptional regulator|nr:type II toxin-antitoxin system Y4mF family antitoxin [Ignavibacteriaceae bacterium]